MLGRLLVSTRYLLLPGILGAFLLSAALFVVGLVRAVLLVLSVPSALATETAAKVLSVDAIEVVDTMLIATALYIISVGLYELFIEPLEGLPRWLVLDSLDDLKERLLGVIVVVLAVTFLASATKWTGNGDDLLRYGLSISAVIIALTLYGWLKPTKQAGRRNRPGGD